MLRRQENLNVNVFSALWPLLSPAALCSQQTFPISRNNKLNHKEKQSPVFKKTTL